MVKVIEAGCMDVPLKLECLQIIIENMSFIYILQLFFRHSLSLPIYYLDIYLFIFSHRLRET